MPNVELVVSRFDEDLAWVPEALRLLESDSARATVYDKSPGGNVANVGREAHTFLHHICERYDDGLADVTVFLQGDPAPHVPGRRTAQAVAGAALAALKAPPGEALAVPVAGYGCDLECDAAGAPHHAALDLRGLSAELGLPPLRAYVFSPGAQYAATRGAIRHRPLEFWEAARRLAAERPLGPWEFERLWPLLFSP